MLDGEMPWRCANVLVASIASFHGILIPMTTRLPRQSDVTAWRWVLHIAFRKAFYEKSFVIELTRLA